MSGADGDKGAGRKLLDVREAAPGVETIDQGIAPRWRRRAPPPGQAPGLEAGHARGGHPAGIDSPTRETGPLRSETFWTLVRIGPVDARLLQGVSHAGQASSVTGTPPSSAVLASGGGASRSRPGPAPGVCPEGVGAATHVPVDKSAARRFPPRVRWRCHAIPHASRALRLNAGGARGSRMGGTNNPAGEGRTSYRSSMTTIHCGCDAWEACEMATGDGDRCAVRS